jgi:hypothetical protein
MSAQGNALKARGTEDSSFRELFRTGNIFPWLYPTVDFLHFDKGPGSGDAVGGVVSGSIALPAVGANAIVLQWKVPRGRNGRITHFGIDVVANGGAAFTVGIVPPQLSFSFFLDASQGTTGSLFPDYENFSFLPGSTINPTQFADGLMIVENQLVTLVVNNLTLVKTTQFVAGRCIGYYYPKNREPRESGNR